MTAKSGGHSQRSPNEAITRLTRIRTSVAMIVLGRKLTRDEALRHPRLADFWRIVDVDLLADGEIRDHLNEAGA